MPTPFILPSFAKGEIAPSLHGRVDTAAYQAALRLARNIIIHSSGGASNRPGTVAIGPVKDHTAAPRLFDFRFRVSDQYVLEMGNLYMRVIRDDAYVTNAAVTITAATQTKPVVVTAASHGFSNGDEVFISGIAGMTELNGNRYIVANQTANTFELTHQVTGLDIDGTRFEPYASAGVVASIFELVTPYVQADLANLKMVQSGDIATITHASYAPRDLARTDHNAWTLTVNTYAPGQAAPTTVAVVQQGTSGSTTHRYKVTAIRREEDVFEESLSGISSTTRTVTSATAANPVVCTSTAHGYVTGDEVELSGFSEMTEVNGRRFIVVNQTANTFELEGEDGSGYAAETTGGSANATFVEVTNSISVALTDLTSFNQVSWVKAEGAGRYAIYRREGGIYGLIAEVEVPITTFNDVTTAVTATGAIHGVDLSVGPPRARNPFFTSGNYPGASSYHEQRQMYGGTTDDPDTSFYSQTGNRLNMSVSTPIQADDAITTVLGARQVNEIRHFVPLTDLLVLTDSAEWRISTGDNSGFSASTLSQSPQSEWGASHHRPIVIGETVLFVEDGAIRVYGMGFLLNSNRYVATDLTILASHLLAAEGPDKYAISDWTYASRPDSRVYVVRSDGKLLTMTFNEPQQVVAWTQWDTRGKFEAITSLRRSVSGVEDGVYFVVKRKIDGNTVRYVERLSTRKFADVRDVFFVDCGLTLDSPVTITDVTAANPVVVTAASHGLSDEDLVDLSDIEWASSFDEFDNEVQPDQLNDRRYVVINTTTNTMELVENESKLLAGATQANPVVVTSPGHGFGDGETIYISGVQGMTDLNGNSYTVANAADDTFELLNTNGLLFSAWTAGGIARRYVDGTAHAAYVDGGKIRKAVTILTGLGHLEAESAVIVADGELVPAVSLADATSDNPTTVVVDGKLKLRTPASRVHVGLKYVSDLETLDVESTASTIQGKSQRAVSVTTRFEKSRLPLIGPNKDNLIPMKQRDQEKMGEPTGLLTGDKKTVLPPDWESNGRVFYRQNLPFPTTWLAIIPNMDIGDDND